MCHKRQTISPWNQRLCSIHFFNRGATSAPWCSTSHIRHSASGHPTTTCSLVDLHHDWIHNTFKLLLLGFEFILLSKLILVKPIQCVLHGLFNLVLVITFKLLFQLLFLQSVAHGEAIVLQTILGFDFAFILLILGPIFFSFLNHTV